MRSQCDLRAEAYVFWETVAEFRAKLRKRVPVNLAEFRDDMDVLHEMSDWPQIKIRCVDALIELNGRIGLVAQR